MKIEVNTVDEYVAALPIERQNVIQNLRKIILSNLPDGFKEEISYGMIGYVVPHYIYPKGYHCDPKLPLPFMSIAYQKNFVAIYHMGIYIDDSLMEWFIKEYAKQITTKLDIGKSCIRFKKPEVIPYYLIGELVSKITVNQWIRMYELKYIK